MDKLKQCSGCKAIYYCSGNCQEKDWIAHKAVCKEMKQQAVLDSQLKQYFEDLTKNSFVPDTNLKGAILVITESPKFLNIKPKVLRETSFDVEEKLPYIVSITSNIDRIASLGSQILQKSEATSTSTHFISEGCKLLTDNQFILLMFSTDTGYLGIRVFDK